MSLLTRHTTARGRAIRSQIDSVHAIPVLTTAWIQYAGGLCSLLVSLIFTGCQPAPPPPIDAVVVPPSFTDAGHTWTQQEMTPSDERTLENYFNSQPGVTDNPLLGGKQQLYRNEQGTQRYYFVNSVSGGEPTWLLLECDAGGSFQRMQEGSGIPFSLDDAKQ